MSIIKKIIKKPFSLLKKARQVHKYNRHVKHHDKIAVDALKFIFNSLKVKPVSLSSAEKKILKNKYKNIFKRKYCPNKEYYSLMKGYTKSFNPEYIPEGLLVRIMDYTNASRYKKFLADKGIYNFYFNGINRPTDLVRNINGFYYNSENQIISYDEAIQILMNCGKRIIFKPSVDSFGGKNIKILKDFSEKDLIDSIQYLDKNFVIQEAIKQSNITGQFNETSLNTLRFNVLNLNNKISILNTFMRIGGENSDVDNSFDGGSMIGVNQDGTLNDFSVNDAGLIEKEHHGIVFAEYKIPIFDEIKEFVITAAKTLPFQGLIAFDIGIDANDKPTLIEVNLQLPGVVYAQVYSGPLFGDRYQEVMDFIKSSILKESKK